ncbi:hypothetical protein W97_01762 [Coniosporium apollinis CBS 100218]|uniref:Protoheme IX farnesyltransferase, mitochondrial n=1 Tax=Coniosporium apollinis (strain CBS 100218) TaxID=1168221 RepID=R7YL42_CONA1|nr:uncharacterized protein W97_01762 [Coniosporium apollinis CBS 100218]EON62539.1 hypothetical protein W97_01762 [Coniosporium apollinis CBS 100218]
MLVRPRLLQPAPLRDAHTVCLRCLQRLSRAAPPSRRTISSTAPVKDAVVTARHPRGAFKKEYFWGNGILEEVLSGAKRGVWSSSASVRQEGSIEGSAAIQQTADIASQHVNTSATATTASLLKEELPHRRRKRLREEARLTDPPEPTIPLDASSQLSTLSQSLPTHSLRRLITTYLSLSKPRLTFLVVLTTTAAYSLYPVPALLSPALTDTPSLSTLTLLFLTTGTALCSASANALNMLLEPAHDAKMSRTRNRPLVRGLISKRGALLFALATGALGTAGLYIGVNPTTAFLGALNIALYAGCYTPLKRVHVLNTWVGAVVGGIPPLMGWAAAAGQCASHDAGWRELLFGEGSAGGWLLAALLFAWQFPHFNALSWTIREEYKHAGYRMLAWTNPARNGRVALRYSLLMFPVCVGLAVAGVTDYGFVATSAAVNGWMTWQAWRFWRYEGLKGSARGLFWASVWHLPIVLVLAMVHKRGLWERVWRSLMGRSGEEEEEWEYEDEVPAVGKEALPA